RRERGDERTERPRSDGARLRRGARLERARRILDDAQIRHRELSMDVDRDDRIIRFTEPFLLTTGATGYAYGQKTNSPSIAAQRHDRLPVHSAMRTHRAHRVSWPG